MKISRRKFIEIAGFGVFFSLMAPGALKQAESTPLRPPGSLHEKDFVRKCIRCFRCGQVCPTRAIQFGEWQDGSLAETPILADLQTNPCNLCMECTNICPSGAIRSLEPTISDVRNYVKIGVAQIKEWECVLINGRRRICGFCLRACPLMGEAIYINEQGWPEISSKSCVGCGLCAQVCPPKAIDIRGISYE